MDTAIQLQHFREHFRDRKGTLIGYPLTFCKVTPQDINLEDINEANQIQAN